MAEGAKVRVEHFVHPEVMPQTYTSRENEAVLLLSFFAGIELAALLITITADPKALAGKVSF